MKSFLICTVFALVFLTDKVLGSGKGTIVRESLDEDHINDKDHLKYHTKDRTSLDAGTKDGEDMDADTDNKEVHPGGGKNGRGGGNRGGGGGGRLPNLPQIQAIKDRMNFHKNHQDMLKFGQDSEVEFEQDSSRKRDRTSHKKEEIYA